MKKNSKNKKGLQTPIFGKNPFVVLLTDEELESLKKWTKDAKIKLRREFQSQLKNI